MIITVVTPTLNASRFLRDCIESVQRAESKGVEVEHLIVDGGSTDGTVEMARSYGLRVITGTDRGIFDAINTGSFASSGDLLGFLGGDDVMLHDGLERIAEAYRRSTKRWFVGGIRWLDADGDDRGVLRAPPTWMTPRIYASLQWNPLMHMATYIRREFFAELGGFDITYKIAGDFEMFARALEKEPFERIPRPIACFRLTGDNASTVNLRLTNFEVGTIHKRFGPKSVMVRMLWRYLLWYSLDPRLALRLTAQGLARRLPSRAQSA